MAIDFLRKVSRVLEEVDLVLYDVPGDIVCGGFSAPIRKGLVSQAYIITSGSTCPYMLQTTSARDCSGLIPLFPE